MKIVLDSSTVISLADNCLLWVLKDLKEKLNIEFIVPPGVVYESVDYPSTNVKFSLNALRIKTAISEGIFSVFNETDAFKKYVNQINHLSNSIYYIQGKPIKIVHRGEIEALAVLALTNADILAIDERTTRQLIESPTLIKEHMENIHRTDVEMNEKKLNQLYRVLENVYIIRSVELLAMAYERNFLKMDNLESKAILKAALYAVKFGGCAVSFDEIEEYLVNA